MPQCPQCGTDFIPDEHSSACPRCGAEAALDKVAAHPATVAVRSTPKLTMLLIAVNVVIYLMVALASGSLMNPSIEKLVDWGANYGPLTLTGQWWRLETSTFLHGNLPHILLNMWALLNLGLLAEIIFGAGGFFALYTLAGLGGSVASLWWHPTVVGVGASGAIFGLAGALLPALFFEKNTHLRAAMRGNLASIALFVVYNIAYGATSRQIDNAAHVGGLATGLLLGITLPRVTSSLVNARLRRALVIVAVAVVIVGVAGYITRSSGAVVSYANARRAVASGDIPKAIAEAKRAVALDPELTEAHELLADLYLASNAPESAIPELEAVIRQEPDYAFGHARYCVALLSIERVAQAEAACSRAVQLHPKNANIQFNLGLASRANGKPEQAVQAFAAAARLRPNSPEENYFYGVALMETKSYDEAVQQFEKVLKLDPSYQGAQAALDEARRRMNK